MEWRMLVSVMAALLVVAANGDYHKHRVKRQIYYPNSDYEDLEYQPRDHVSTNTGHLPIAPHYPADPYQSNSYQPPPPSNKPVEPLYEVPYKPPGPSYEQPTYKPTLAPYKPPVPVYKPTPAPYKPNPPTYKPSPAPHIPPAPAYKPTPKPYKPTSPTYRPKPVYHEPTYNEPENRPYKEKNTIPGVPGQDYPTYNKIPYTKFTCQDVPYRPGMYANPEAGCQVYHVCDDDRHGPQGASFLCTNGTLFNQETFNCDWWYNVDCSQATSLYQLNTDPDQNPYYKKPYEGPLHVPKYIHQDVYNNPETSYEQPKRVYHAPSPKPSYHTLVPSYKHAPRSAYHDLAPKSKPTYHATALSNNPPPKQPYHVPVTKPRPTYHTHEPTYKPDPKATYTPFAPKPNNHKPQAIYESTESNYKPRPWKAPAYKPSTTYQNKRETEGHIGFSADDESIAFAWGHKI